MKSAERPQTITQHYEIAGLTLAIHFPSTINAERFLPSFTSFRKNDHIGPVAASVTFVDEEPPVITSYGILRCDFSVVWGDDFRFYEQEDTYITLIKHQEKAKQWMMSSTRDFRESTISGKTDDPRIAALFSWLIMVIFGQIGLQHQLILIHASAIAYKQTEGIAFLGKSGTGKSTHSKLWLQYIPDTDLLNDDNPAIGLDADGNVAIYGTPWSGKTPCYKNKKLWLKGLVRLQQAAANKLTQKKGAESLITVLPSCTALRWNKDLFDAMTETLAQLLANIKVVHLECLPDADAARLSYEAVFTPSPINSSKPMPSTENEGHINSHK